MRQQEKEDKQASEPKHRVMESRDEERQKARLLSDEDDNPQICRGMD